MFGWFSPKCPLDTWEKTWTEWRMRWLADEFGVHRLLDAQVILPTDEFFPDQIGKSTRQVRRLMDQLCGYMDIDESSLDLEICEDVQLPGVAGHYDDSSGTTIRIARSQLEAPMALVATMAHELAHVLLLGSGRLQREVKDQEWVTDLLPVFLGLGIFGANATLHEKYLSEGDYSSWTIGRQGYLPARIFGYAFALFAAARGENEPAWMRHLRPDASAACRAGLRFLKKSDDALFHPGTLHEPRRPSSLGDLLPRLASASATVRLATLFELDQHLPSEPGLFPVDPDLVCAVAACLRDSDGAIVTEAARALSKLGPDVENVEDAARDLVRALHAGSPTLRVAAIHALGAIGCATEPVLPELSFLLEDRDREVVSAACDALAQFGPRAQLALPRLLPTLKAALIECDEKLIQSLATALLAILPDPKKTLQEFFTFDDAELKRLALEALKRCRRKQKW